MNTTFGGMDTKYMDISKLMSIVIFITKNRDFQELIEEAKDVLPGPHINYLSADLVENKNGNELQYYVRSITERMNAALLNHHFELKKRFLVLHVET